MNKYERIPEYVVDLHGKTVREAEKILFELIEEGRYAHVRIITGKGMHSGNGGVLRDRVKDILESRGIRWGQSKIRDGGEGALEVYLEVISK